MRDCFLKEGMMQLQMQPNQAVSKESSALKHDTFPDACWRHLPTVSFSSNTLELKARHRWLILSLLGKKGLPFLSQTRQDVWSKLLSISAKRQSTAVHPNRTKGITKNKPTHKILHIQISIYYI